LVPFFRNIFITRWAILGADIVYFGLFKLKVWGIAGRNMYVVLVPDQAGWDVVKALQVPINITLLHLPRYNPELNPAERLWVYV